MVLVWVLLDLALDLDRNFLNSFLLLGAFLIWYRVIMGRVEWYLIAGWLVHEEMVIEVNQIVVLVDEGMEFLDDMDEHGCDAPVLRLAFERFSFGLET